MCGRYVSATPVEEIASYFAAEPDPDLAEVARPRYNVPPTEPVLGVVEEPKRSAGPEETSSEAGASGGSAGRAGSGSGPGDERGAAPGVEPAAAQPVVRRIRAYRWGLVPPWAKDLSAGNRAFNARAESVATKPAFRSAFRARRLLVPATAFYEWQRTGGRRQPFAFRRADGAPLAFAGLWERWRDPETGVWVRSLTIITTDAGPDVAAVHDRQPVVVEPEDFERWLSPGPGGTVDLDQLPGILAPSAKGTLVAFPVDPAVGNTANDSPRLFEPLEQNAASDPLLRGGGPFTGAAHDAANDPVPHQGLRQHRLPLEGLPADG